jgi:hypothetical protein
MTGCLMDALHGHSHMSHTVLGRAPEQAAGADLHNADAHAQRRAPHLDETAAPEVDGEEETGGRRTGAGTVCIAISTCILGRRISVV